jgi:hypothetical protein
MLHEKEHSRATPKRTSEDRLLGMVQLQDLGDVIAQNGNSQDITAQ